MAAHPEEGCMALLADLSWHPYKVPGLLTSAFGHAAF